MNRNRRNRLNLSLVRKSESPKSPVQDRSSVTEVISECNTPLNSRKRSSTISDGSPVLNDYDSPILMSQDTSNMVTGVSWAWNSPKRTIPEDCRPKPRPLLASNNILPPKEPDLRKQTTERLVGFYKFQMELKKIQLEAQQNPDQDVQQKFEVKSPSPKLINDPNLLDSFGETNTSGDPQTAAVADEPPVNPPFPAQIDSFNDSAFDSLLLQASQAAETKSQNVLDTATTSNEGSDSIPVKRKSFFKSRTINDLDSINVNDLLNDSIDFCLIEASQMVEGNMQHNHDHKTTAEQSSSKKTSSLTRHKSLPASPSQKVPATKKPEATSVRSKCDANFLNSDSSSRAATSHGLSSSPQPVRLCTKEEIEQKRQEALKRQQVRLNRLGGLGNTVLNNNHLASSAKKS